MLHYLLGPGADLSLYSYENEMSDNMMRIGHRRLARPFNLCYRYNHFDDLIAFNNKNFMDYLKDIYISQLTVEKTNKSDHIANYLDLTLWTVEVNFRPGFMTNVMNLTSATYHLVPLTVYNFTAHMIRTTHFFYKKIRSGLSTQSFLAFMISIT